MSNPKRDTVEIFLELLSASESPIRPTHLLTVCNLSWHPLMEYVEFLIEKGYMEKVDPAKLGRSLGARKDKRSKYQLQTTIEGRQIVVIFKAHDVRSLFGYTKWLKDKRAK